jgi:asparagine synthetase B (glutamine-hydrolysing)
VEHGLHLDGFAAGVSSPIRILGALNDTFGWDGSRLYGDLELGPGTVVPDNLRGPASVALADQVGNWRLLRDPLGINKVFWAHDGAGGILVAEKPQRLVAAGVPLASVFSLPAGCLLDLGPDRQVRRCTSILPRAWRTPTGTDTSIERVATAIRCTLDRYLAALAQAHPHAQVFVCLSGGLDSSGIAALACDHFRDVIAVSFDIARPGGATSEDRRTAERLSRDLGLPLMIANARTDEIFAHLDTVLVDGIDWRDFNVHAGLVNAVLAAAIADAAPTPGGAGRRLVLTGDMANEFLADYQPEQYQGNTYYPLPRLSGGGLRTSLVRGLATSHREVGVFAAWGLTAIQPYSVAVDDYLALPAALFEREDRKQQLCRAIFGNALPEYIYARKKSRAQVGNAQTAGGVLAAAVDQKIDRAVLRTRFAALHGITDEKQLDRFLRGGQYRSGIPFTDQEA